MIATSSRARNRSGLTLIEMLVVVALTVLMMTIIAQIFTATTGAIQIARAYQELEQDLRAIEGTIKRDLSSVTAHMSPPLNPKDNLGYFEYGENEFADAQGEDSDDYLAFTAQYNDGNFFYGRYLPPPPGMPSGTGADTRGAQANIAPTIIAGDTAEVVYFLRNGNLYRRVFLVKPGLKLFHEYAFAANGVYQGVSAANMPGISGVGRVGWQALNDISMRPATHIAPNANDPLRASLPRPGEMVFDTYVNTGMQVIKLESEVRPVANSLGDLTNRENRAFKPRFTNDYYTPSYNATTGQIVGVIPYPDGSPDDFMGAPVANSNGNFDNQINDFTSATYPNLMVNSGRNLTSYGAFVNETINVAGNVPIATYLFPIDGTPATGLDTQAFPFIYPNAYSRTAGYQVPLAANIPAQGAIHGISLEPPNRTYDTTYSAPQTYFLPYWNHNPLADEDNLPTPGDPNPLPSPTIPSANNQSGFLQTWWGFPTWREQLSPFWVDPLKRLDSRLQVSLPNAVPYQLTRGMQPYGLSWSNTGNYQGQSYGWLPEMVAPTRTRDQYFSEPSGTLQSGSNSMFYNNMSVFWYATWEDDLIATNVRSFDVKAFDASPEIQSYVDLGYFATTTGGASVAPSGSGPFAPSQTTTFANWLSGFGHEGRMPPLTSDYRTDAQYPFIPGIGPRFVGDDSPGVVRLRRVWDTWSTDYSATETRTLDPLTSPPFQVAPRPSYPAPYPAPLHGIQVQIRMTDPREERVRTITIHQDFTSKL